MHKLKSKAGLSLLEMLLALMILVFLVLGMGVGMDAGSRIYRESWFENESASLAGILNTALGDILRYSTDVKGDPDQCGNPSHVVPLDEEEMEILEQRNDVDVGFVFTSMDYGVQDAYFRISQKGALTLESLRNESWMELVNSGAYPNLEVADFTVKYTARIAPGVYGGYFEINYTIYSTDSDKSKDVTCIVRHLNDGA